LIQPQNHINEGVIGGEAMREMGGEKGEAWVCVGD